MKIERVSLFALILAASVAFAQAPPASPFYPGQAVYSQQELDQMLAPIALYPDPLLSQILMASTYPLEVVEAARWSRANPGLRGEDAVTAVAGYSWDPSVQSMVAFPQILATMDERLDWTQRLGNAFLAQEAQVMDTIQALRRRAYEAGNLRTNDRIRYEDRGGVIVLEPADPRVYYVPYYDPQVVYGPWWWPGYPPVYWPVWPGYVSAPAIVSGILWGVGVAIIADFFFGDLDWGHHHVAVRPVTNFYYRGHGAPGPRAWQHEPEHRRGVPYRGEAVRQQFRRPPSTPAPDTRRPYRGYEQPAAGWPAAPGDRRQPQVGAPRPGERPQAPAAAPKFGERPQAPAAAPKTGERPQAPAAAPKTGERPRAPAATTQPAVRPPAPAAAPQPAARPQAPAAAPQPTVRPQAPAATPKPAMRPQAPIAARPEAAPRAFEGIRAGGNQTREYSARGQSSMSQRSAPTAAPRSAPAPRSGGAPAGAGARRR